MSVINEELMYTEEHEWVKLNEDGTALIGITDHAQSELGDVVFIEAEDGEFSTGESVGTIEAVKTVAELYVPFDCEVLEFNEALEDDASNVNTDPYGAWIVKVNITGDTSSLITPSKYRELVG